MLISTEKRLAKNATHAEVYQKQIEDMVDREVARKLTLKELKEYKGPIHYISHHEVLKPESKSTPVRIVFNSNARYMTCSKRLLGERTAPSQRPLGNTHKIQRK